MLGVIVSDTVANNGVTLRPDSNSALSSTDLRRAIIESKRKS